MNSTNNSLCHLIHRAEQAATVIFAGQTKDAGVTTSQAVVLLALDGKIMSQTELVAATGIDRSTMADIVRRLIRNGLITRKRAKEDARRYGVWLTKDGERALAGVRNALDATNEALLSRVPVKSRPGLVTALSAMAAE